MATLRTLLKVKPLIPATTGKELSALAWIEDAYGNVLFVRQLGGKNLWTLPGGKINATESLADGLRREVREETGLLVASAEVLDLFDRPERASLAILYRTILKPGKIKLGVNEIETAAFLGRLPTNSTPSAKHFWLKQRGTRPALA